MRARKAFCVCYEDSCPNLDISLACLGCDAYAYIKHDLDVTPEGELKKPHYHVYLEFENAKEFSVIGKELGCGENNVEKVKSTKGCVRYLIHADNPEKAQYDKQNIVSVNLDIEKYLSDYSERSKVVQILGIIYELRADVDADGRIVPHTFGDVVSECCNRNLYDALRRGNSLFLEVWRNG